VTCHLRRCVTQMTRLIDSMEYEAVVVKLSSSEALRVLHEFERFNPLTHRRGNTRTGGRGRPHSDPPEWVLLMVSHSEFISSRSLGSSDRGSSVR
jgi:hypothetical protein